jgi:hypothetical protein
MQIEYIAPLSGGWNRMKNALFRPFNISKWFILGFSVFLADLLDYDGGGSGSSSFSNGGHFDWYDFFHFPQHALEWLKSNPFWSALIFVGIILLIFILVLLTWISSRGKFIFLDNVINDTAQIVEPWRAHSLQGNSLFLWRLVFGTIILLSISSILTAGFIISYNYYLGFYNLETIIIFGAGFFILGLLLIIILSYISLFLDHFVVPLMHKNRIKTNHAWRLFLNLFNRQAGYFFVYGFFILGLSIIVVIAVIFFGLVTCCCGFLLLATPYIGSVILLPVSYTFRALSLEFLEQFGEEYKMFPEAERESIED